jgi:choice-of-anchor A domain-containing protein
MPLLRHLIVASAAACAGQAAQAGVLDLSAPIGNANVYAIKNFTSNSSDTEGAIVAGGNVTLSGYRVNGNDVDAFNNYSLVAGGKVSLSNGDIVNGKTYGGAGVSVTSGTHAGVTTVNPVDFKAAEIYYKTLATSLDALANTGTVKAVANKTVVSGSGKGGVDVFDVSGNIFLTGSEWKLENLVDQQTLIFNVSGTTAGFNPNGIEFASLSGYNVLFNFYQATTLDPSGVIGSILAPYATVTKNWTQVNGNVIVDTWNSTI